MTRKLTLALLSGAALVAGACGNAETVAEAPAATVDASAVEAGRAKAVLVYADWCGSCKALEPNVEAARSAGDLPVEFVTLDYTDKDADAFFSQADAAGVGQAVRAKMGDSIKTGQLLLVDLDDQEVRDVVTKSDTPVMIRTKIVEAAAAS